MSTVQVDTINESTTGSGVTVDGVLIKDGQVDGVDVSTLSVDTNGLVKLSSATASASSELVFDNFVDTSTYTNYKIIYEFIKAATDTAELRLTFRTGGASGSDITGTYRRQNNYSNLTTTSMSRHTLSTTDYAQLYQMGNADREELSAISYFYPSNGTNGMPYTITETVLRYPDGNNYANTTYNLYGTATNTTGIKFFMSSGNITSGSIHIYGVKK